MGYCPFPVLGHHTTVVSRHEGPSVHDRHTCAHDKAPALITEDLRACLGRPVATCFLGCSVAIEDSLSRQEWFTLCRDRDFSVPTGSWAVRAFGVTTQFWCCDKGVVLLVWFYVTTQFCVMTWGTIRAT